MPAAPTCAHLDSLNRLADAVARNLRRRLRLPRHEQEDVRQDLLADFLVRLPAYEPARGDLLAFAMTCFRHRASRLANRHRREREVRADLSLDDPLPGGEGLTVGGALTEDAGFSAWLGQPTDRIAALERRLDVERTADAALLPADLPLCAALVRGEARAPAAVGLSRTTAFRRMREMRLRLMAAGVSSAA
jgi:hypothetical protein